MSLTVVDHPLVRDRLGVLRDRRTGSARFRRLTRELGGYLAYEATRDLPVESFRVTTPLGIVAGCVRVTEPGPVVVPILRAGLGLLDGVLGALPTAEVGVVGLSRDEETLRPVAYLERLRDDLSGRHAFVVDPMLATGGSMARACSMLAERGAARITALCVLASPEGVARVRDAHASVHVVTAALDDGLDERGFILPGLGDAGDRLFGLA